MAHLFDAWKCLNWGFWKLFPKNPRICMTFVLLTAWFFVADCLWFFFSPKKIRDWWEYGNW